MILFAVSDFLLDSSSLTLTASQVEQSSSSHFTFSQQFDFLDGRRKDRENSFHTNTIGDFSYCESLTVGVRVFSLDYSSLELLDTLFVTFSDSYVHVDGISSLERREFGSSLAVFRFYKFY